MNDRPEDDPTTCEAFRSELAARLYEPLAPARETALGAHLAGCPACRLAQAAQSEAKDELARWTLPDGLEGAEDPRALVEQARASLALETDEHAEDAGVEGATLRALRVQPRADHDTPTRPKRRVAGVLVAAAAALFVVGLLGGIELEAGDGRITLAFGLPGSDRGADEAAERQALLEELAPRFATLAAEVEALRLTDERLRRDLDDGRARTDRALETARTERRLLGAELAAVSHAQDRENDGTRRAIFDIASAVALLPQQ